MKQKVQETKKKYFHSHLIELILIGLICGVLYYLSEILQLHDKFVKIFNMYEFLEFDEIFYIGFFIFFGLGLFSYRRFNELKKEITYSTFSKLKLQKEVDELTKVEDYLRVQENYARMTLLLIKKLEFSNTYDEILNAIKKTLFDVMGYKTAWFYKFSEDRKTAELIFTGKIPPFIKQNEMQHVEIASDEYYTRIANTHEIDIVEDALLDELTFQKSFINGLEIRTLVHIPLLLSDKSIGLLGAGTFGNQGIKIPNSVELEFIKNLSGHVALALNRVHLQAERSSAEEALKNSEEKYRILIDQSADAIYLQKDGKYEIINSKFIEMFGLTLEDINSPTFTLLDFTHPKSIPILQERIEKVKKGEELPPIYEFTALTKDKREIELEASISYIYADGIVKTQGVLRDITKRKRAESIQSAVYQISEAANMTDHLEELITKIHHILKSIMYAENFYVVFYNEKTDLYNAAYFIDQFDTIDYEPMNLQGSLTDYVRRTEKAAIIDEKKHAQLAESGEAKYILKPSKTWMGAPLKTPFGVIGVIAVQSYEDANLYSSEDLELLNLISGQIAIAIEKKKTDEEKEKNNKFFKTVINSLTNPLYVINVNDYSIAVANTAAKEIVFNDKGKNEHCFKLRADNGGVCCSLAHSCPIEQMIRSKKPVKFEHQIVSDNIENMYEVHGFPIFDESGNVIQIIEYLVDITNRKQVENKLAELAVFPEVNPNIILSMNSNQEITYMNSATSQILGEIGISRVQMFDCLPENLKELIEEMLDEGSGMQDIRVKINEHTLAWSFQPVIGQDIIHCYAYDITQQVLQADEINKLSTVVTQSSNIIMIINLAGVVEYVNPYFTLVTGYEKEEIVGCNFNLINSNNKSNKIFDDLWNSISKGITWNGKIENRKKNGEFYWESKTISSIVNERGEIISYISVGTDITNELKTQQQLIESEKHSAIATLAAGVAHEFKNYLGGIIGNASFSLDEIDSEDGLPLAKETLIKIIEMGEKANDVAMSLLTFSKAKSDDRKKEDLEKIIKQSIKLVEKEFETLSIEVATHFEDVQPVEVSLSKIQQLLLNLFINAKHAIGSDGVMTVALVRKGEFVEIRVGDSGNGIEKENQDKIFDPFFSTKGVWGEDKVSGTGMGLSICRNIALEHNGDLKVESVLGIGSVFTISLPVAEVSDLKSSPIQTNGEKFVIFFTLNHSLVTNYYTDVCNSHLQLLLVDNFDKMDEHIIEKTAYVICDARFSAKLELYRMVEFCIEHNRPYVMVLCGTMEYQLTEIYEQSVANYKELPDFYKLINDFETSISEVKSK